MKYVVNKIVELIYANGPSKDKETMVDGQKVFCNTWHDKTEAKS